MTTTSPLDDDTTTISKQNRTIFIWLIIKQLGCFLIMSILALIFIEGMDAWDIILAQLGINVLLFIITIGEATGKITQTEAFGYMLMVLILGEFAVGVGAKTKKDSDAASTDLMSAFNIKVDEEVYKRNNSLKAINSLLDSPLLYQHCLRVSTANEIEKSANFRTTYNTKVENVVSSETNVLKATKQNIPQTLTEPYNPKSLRLFPTFNELTIKQSSKECIEKVISGNREVINTKIKAYNALVLDNTAKELQAEFNKLELENNKKTKASTLTKFAIDAFKEVYLVVLIQLFIAMAAETLNRDHIKVLRRNIVAKNPPLLAAELKDIQQRLRQVGSYAKAKLFLILDKANDIYLIDKIHQANGGFPDKAFSLIPSDCTKPEVLSYVNALENEKVINSSEKTAFLSGGITIYSVDSKFARDYLNYTSRSY